MFLESTSERTAIENWIYFKCKIKTIEDNRNDFIDNLFQNIMCTC